MLRDYAPKGRFYLPVLVLLSSLSSLSANNGVSILESISLTGTTVNYSGCPGDTVTISGISVVTDCGEYTIDWSGTQDAALEYMLDPADLMPEIIVQNRESVYQLKVTEVCTGNSDSISVTIHPTVMAFTGEDKGLCIGSSIALGGPPVADVIYTWAPSTGLDNPTLANPQVTYPGGGANEIKYYLTAQGPNGCAVQDSVTVTFHETPQPDFATVVTCEGAGMTFNNLTPNPASVAQWLWTFGDNSSNSNEQAPVHAYANGANYQAKLKATTVHGCSAEMVKTVKVASKPGFLGVTSANPNDCGSNDGKVTILANAAHVVSPGIEYSIDGGNTWKLSHIFNGLAPGSYPLKVRNGGVCEMTGTTVQLVQPPQPEILDVTRQNPSNCEVEDGSITITARGGIGTYRYSIDGVNWYPNHHFTQLGAGSYPVLVRNSDGTCRVSNGLTVLSEPAAPVITFVKTIHPSDCGASNGAIKIHSAGGFGTHQYSIDGGNTWTNADSFPNLSKGVFPIKVRNSNGTCEVTGGSAELKDPASPKFVNVLPVNPSDCGAQDGVIEIDAVPGAAAVQYSIDGGTTWQGSNIFHNLSRGTYSLALRNATGSCPVTANNVVLQEPPAPQIQAVVSSNPVDCGTHDGSILIEAAGGTGSYSFSIDGGNSWSHTGSFQNLQGGVYPVMVSNADGTCVKSGNSVNIIEPVAPTNASFTAQDPTVCQGEDGVINMTAQGLDGVEFSVDAGSTWQPTGDFPALNAGTYELMVRNADGTCETSTGIVDLNAPDGITIDEIIHSNVTDCGRQDGAIEFITAYSGSAELEYSIDDGNAWHGSSSFTNLAGGNYKVRVRAIDGTCEVRGQTVEVKAPKEVPVSGFTYADITDCGKTDGKIILLKTDTFNFEVSLDGGLSFANQTFFTQLGDGTYHVQVRNVDGTCFRDLGEVVLSEPVSPLIDQVDETAPSTCQTPDGKISIYAHGSGLLQASIDGGVSWQSQGDYRELIQGDYPVMVRNSDKSCEEHGPMVALRAGDSSLEVTITEEKPACGASDGSLKITTTGAPGVKEYSIDGGESWSSTGEFNNLPKGIYHILIKETASDCMTDAGRYQLEESGHPVFDSYSFVQPSHCLSTDGSLEIEATGSAGALDYSIDGGMTWQSNPLFTGLGSGTFVMKVRYANGSCAVGEEIAVLTAPGAPVVASLDMTSPACGEANGTIVVHAATPSSGLEYALSTGGSFTWQPEPVFASLQADDYIIKVRNADGSCESFGGVADLHEPAKPGIDEILPYNPDCSVDDGSIEITLSGDLAGLTEFSIDNGANWRQGNLFENLPEGAYHLRVRNMSTGEWCEVDGGFVSLTKPVAPTMTVSVTNPSDCGREDGRIQVNATGQRPLEYSLDGDTWTSANVFEDLPGGAYQAFVRYANESCEVASPAIMLNTLAMPVINEIVTLDPDCHNEGAMIEIEAQGSTGTLEYSVDGGQTWQVEPVFEDLASGNYDIQIRYTGGTCQVDGNSITLTNPAAPAIQKIESVTPGCDETNGRIKINASLTGQPASLMEYSIDGGNTWQADPEFMNLAPGDYGIMIRRTDMPCETDGGMFTLREPERPEIVITDYQSPTDCNVEDGIIEVFALGRSGQPGLGLEYSIDEGAHWQSSPYFENLTGGDYPVRVRFLDGTCMAGEETIELDSPSAPSRDDLKVVNPDCDKSNGRLTLAASGGGQSAVQFSINGGGNWSSSGNFTGLPAGNYSVAYRYVDGTCMVADTTIELVSQNQPNLQSTSYAVPSGCDATDGNITFSGNGYLSMEYSLNGQNWQSSGVFSSLTEGNYKLWIRYTDKSCPTLLDSIDLVSPNSVEINDVSSINISDCDLTDGSITITTDMTAGIEFTINGQNWQANPIFENLPAGTYHPAARLTSHNCMESWQDVIIQAPEALVFEDLDATPLSDCGVADGKIFIDANFNQVQASIDGGQNWADGTSFSHLPEGEYEVWIRKADGTCVTEYPNNPVRVIAPAAPAVSIAIEQPECRRSNGKIVANATIISNPNNLPVQYALNHGQWQTDNVFSGLAGGTYTLTTRLAGTFCMVDKVVSLEEPHDCPPCEPVFGASFLEYEEETMTNPICVPMPLSATLSQELFLDGNTVAHEGGCDADSVFFYVYSQLALLGGTDGPFQLVHWKLNGTDYSGTFQTIDALVDAMNDWDPTGDWSHDATNYSISGGTTSANYGTMRLTHARTNRTVTLTNNLIPSYNGINLTVDRAGLHHLVAYNDADACHDTLAIYIKPRPVPQAFHFYEKMEAHDPVEICDWQPQISYQPEEVNICQEPSNGTLVVSPSGCARYRPDAGFAGYDSYCVLTCYDRNGNPFCDTAYVHIAVPPASDEIYLTMEPGASMDTCISGKVQLPAASVTAGNCGGSGVTWTATPGNETCITLTANNTFSGATTLCLVHCDDVPSPLGPLCDTTYLKIDVQQHCPDDILTEEVLTADGFNGIAEVCLPLPMFKMDDYSLKIDGNDYNGNYAECDIDSVYTYSYLVLPGMGQSGPYRVDSWNVNGGTFGGNVANMNALVDSMNRWAPQGNWVMYPDLFTIMGKKDNDNIYGKLKVTQPSLGLSVEVLPDEAEFAKGTSLEIRGNGPHILLIEDIDNLCADRVVIEIDNEVTPTVTDIYNYNTVTNQSIVNQCLPVAELPGNPVSLSFCEDVQHGTLTFNNYNCFDYIPFTGFTGMDSACVIICDDLGVCDTSIVHISVDEPVTVCDELFDEASIDLELDYCGNSGNICLPVSSTLLADFNLFVNGNAYTGNMDTCDDGQGQEGTAIRLPVGTHELLFRHTDSVCNDTVMVNVACKPLEDLTIDRTVAQGASITICLSNLNLPFDEDLIANISNMCQTNQHVWFDYNMVTNCITITGLFGGLDSVCYGICLQNGDCFTLTIRVDVTEPCRDFILEDRTGTGVDCSKQDLELCVNGLSISTLADYSLEINNQPFTQNLTACSMDSTFAFSYFSLPGQGMAGPYRVVSWRVDNQIFSGEFENVPALIDSLNRWDPTGNWRHHETSLGIVGGNPDNQYGSLSIVQVATNAPTVITFTSTIVPRGVGVTVDQPGSYQMVFTQMSTGCRDTVMAVAACVTTEVIRDTIFANETGQMCLPEDELVTDFARLANLCEDASGEYVLFDWGAQQDCISYLGVEEGEEYGCFLTCDDIGVCDTAMVIIRVLPERYTGPVVAMPDTMSVIKGEFTVLNIFGNDIYGRLDEYYIVTPPQHGSAVFLPDATLKYTPNGDYCNESVPDSLTYVVCSSGTCDTSTVYIFIECELIKVYNGFSPNGDGINDKFQIRGVDRLPGNRLEVYNRWGVRVFAADNYDNSWEGTWDNVILSTGTYFYRFDDGNGKVYTGYVQLQR